MTLTKIKQKSYSFSGYVRFIKGGNHMKNYRTIEEIANDFVTQDNLGTAMPIVRVLQEQREEVAADGCHYDALNVGIQGEYTTFDTEEEIWECYAEWEGLTVEEAKEKFKDDYYHSMYDLIELLWENPRIIPIKRNHKNSDNFFFTQKGYEEHLLENRHNLRSPRPYGIHLFRNPEMKVILFSIMQHATVPKEQWNHEARRFYNEMLKKVSHG